MKIAVISPKCTSQSAKYIAEQLKTWYNDVTYYNPYQDYPSQSFDLVVNYGCSSNVPLCKRINEPRSVAVAINKLDTFKAVKKDLRVVYTTKKDQALKWIKDGFHVVIRETSVGNRSEGVTITDKEEDINSKLAVFYTKYEPNFYELRVNCFKNKILTILQKEDVDGVFQFKLIRGEPHKELQEIVDEVYNNIGLDICGLDILLTEENKFKLLEVNSGPMLFGQTGIKMVEAIHKEIENEV